MLTIVKLALRITTTSFDTEIQNLIDAGLKDLSLSGVKGKDTDPLIRTAVITYVKYHFGSPSDADKLKTSYDEQKAQLKMSRKYNG